MWEKKEKKNRTAISVRSTPIPRDWITSRTRKKKASLSSLRRKWKREVSGIELIKNSELSRVARLLNEFLMLHSRGCKSHTTFSHFFPLSFLLCWHFVMFSDWHPAAAEEWTLEITRWENWDTARRWWGGAGGGGLMKWNEKCQVLYISSRKTSMKVGNFLSFYDFSHTILQFC